MDTVCFSDFQFSGITAAMHAMPSIIGVPYVDCGLEENSKQKKIDLKSTHFTYGSVVLQHW